MKRGILINLILCVLLISTVFLISGCGSEASEETPSVESIDITISIDYPEKSKLVDIKEVPFRVEEETTVLQTIQLYGNVNNIPILVETTNSTLEGINGIINGVFTKDAKWKFKINGKYVSKAESKKTLESGDHVEFIYAKR